MVDIANWFLSFVSSAVSMILSIQSVDGYSFGYMLIGIIIIGAVIFATIGAVNIFGHNHTISVQGGKHGK